MKLYTDGSCLGNPGKGGWGVICLDDESNPFFKICGGESHTTNNIMELTAVIRGLESYGGGAVTVYTDSKYVMDGITKWIHGWKRNGWKTGAGGEVKNRSLWEQLDRLMTVFITFEWVKAHNGDTWNEAVDKLAKKCAVILKDD